MMVRSVLKRENIGESIHKIGGLGGVNEHNPQIQRLRAQEIYYFPQRRGQEFSASGWFCSVWCFQTPGVL